MYPHSLLLPFLLLCSLTLSHASAPDSFFKSAPSSPNASTEYFELTHSLPTDNQTPNCSVTLLEHDFDDTVGSPPASANFSPPSNCSYEWTAVVVEFAASCYGKQLNRIAAVWIDGVEILRTSTAESTELGVFWNVRKDVTKYASVLQRSNATVSVMLQNEVSDVLTGIYHVNLSLHFYRGQEKGEEGNRFKTSRKLGLLAEDNKERERKVRSLGEESRALGFGAEENEETEGKLAFSSKGNARLGFLGEESVDWDDVDDDDWVRRSALLGEENDIEKLGFLSKEGSEEKQKSKFSHEEHLPLRLPSEDLGMMKHEPKKWNPLSTRPADLIIPISDSGENGFWYRIENQSDTHSTKIQIPVNTYRAVLEIYVSFHSKDEFWYTNPSNKFIQKNNLTTEHGNGTFREVFVTVDGLYVGSIIPFPVLFTGGINPLFWNPVVAIGAFDLPSYNLELTPFLGNLLDGKLHSFSIGVTDSISYWLVNANLHLWVDPVSPQVTANLVKYNAHELAINRKSELERSEGEFKIKAKREFHFSGWVNSSFGNLTTHSVVDIKFKNVLNIHNNGRFKDVVQKIREKTEIRVETRSHSVIAKAIYKNKYPLHIEITTKVKENNTYFSRAKLSHEMKKKSSVSWLSGEISSNLDNSQDSNGWMRVQNQSVISGVATTRQDYKFIDDESCYTRSVASNEGEIMVDKLADVCQ